MRGCAPFSSLFRLSAILLPVKSIIFFALRRHFVVKISFRCKPNVELMTSLFKTRHGQTARQHTSHQMMVGMCRDMDVFNNRFAHAPGYSAVVGLVRYEQRTPDSRHRGHSSTTAAAKTYPVCTIPTPTRCKTSSMQASGSKTFSAVRFERCSVIRRNILVSWWLSFTLFVSRVSPRDGSFVQRLLSIELCVLFLLFLLC